MRRRWRPSASNTTCTRRSGSFCSTRPRARSCRSGSALPMRRIRINAGMNRLLEDLLKVMTLERLELDLFRGESRDIGSPQVFGGQVLGQALVAATATVEKRVVHSLHAYFLRRGDCNSPIVYEVDRARDGNHFSTRRIVAIQHGAQIFNMAASFQSAEEGLDHQLPMPQVPPPETLETLETHLKGVLETLPQVMRRGLEKKRPFEFRLVEPPYFLRQGPVAPVRHVWFRAVDRLPDEARLRRGR